MKYGFVIDNRKCIGCHACTTACKSEHEVPVGVNRTWVKQVEKGEFPNTRRLFSVMRCNQCTDAPCVEICPTESLYYRDDGIVDFDKDRCIGCKSCMQACPYDALYIDPQTHTAAKCNYCAHRIDIGLEPACVNVCPEHAIISGDMDDAHSEISALLARQQVSVRKPEKGTDPNVFYIDADSASLIPSATSNDGTYLWSQQATGVGHFAKEAEKLAFSNGDIVDALLGMDDQYSTSVKPKPTTKSIDVLLGNEARRVYDTPDKGILWGWEVSGYVFTKAISAGAVMIPLIAILFGLAEVTTTLDFLAMGIGMSFLLLTGVLLVMDLDQPKRFLYVLLRPHWGSWLVKGGYTIALFGGLITALVLASMQDWHVVQTILRWMTLVTGVVLAIYTAFLFGQAKGRDFWQSPGLAMHMLIHSLLAGAAVFAIIALFTPSAANWLQYLRLALFILIGINLLTMIFELTSRHPTEDARITVWMITHGQYARKFYAGVIAIGTMLPLVLLIASNQPMMMAGAGLAVLAGIYITEHIWVEAPQRINLT